MPSPMGYMSSMPLLRLPPLKRALFLLRRIGNTSRRSTGSCLKFRHTDAFRSLLRVGTFHVVVENADELLDDMVAAERAHELSIHVDRRDRRLERSRQRDADVGMLALAGPVHHASHHRDLHLFYPRVALLPDGHLPAEIALD